MNKQQKLVLCGGCCLFVLLGLLLVPWVESSSQGATLQTLGYAPIYRPPKLPRTVPYLDGVRASGVAVVDVTRLSVQLLVAAVITAVGLVFTKNNGEE